MTQRNRNIVITSWTLLLPDPSTWPHCTFCIFQLEISAHNRLHWQMYAEFDVAIVWSTLHTYDGLDNPPAHFEVRRGTQAQAIAYASKLDTRVEGPFTYGVPKHQGQSVALTEVAGSLKAGASLRDIASSHPVEMIRHATGISKFQVLVATPRPDTLETLCFVFYGAGGTGKSTFARKLASYLGTRTFKVPSAKGSGLYWDGYSQGDVVLIDEFKGNRMQPTEFNQLIDKGPHQVPVHGGTTEFNSRYVIITTNVNPRQWWDIEYMRSLRRRIVLFPIFRNLSYRKKPVQPCIYCAEGLCAFHHI